MNFRKGGNLIPSIAITFIYKTSSFMEVSKLKIPSYTMQDGIVIMN